jgi:hypothetical protein
MAEFIARMERSAIRDRWFRAHHPDFTEPSSGARSRDSLALCRLDFTPAPSQISQRVPKVFLITCFLSVVTDHKILPSDLIEPCRR